MDLKGIEPLTSSLQMKCSSQLSYRPFSRTWWAHQDSNLGPQSYQDCALNQLSYTPLALVLSKELAFLKS